MNVLFTPTFLDFGFVLIFGVLAAACFFVHLPPAHEQLRSYRKSRQILGMGLAIIAVYCLVRLVVPHNHADFIDLWLLVLFTFYFAWLSYSSFLFLIETPKYTTRYFLIDGLIPLVSFIVLGVIGLIFPATQKVLNLLFGFIYVAKCIWMFIFCLREYRKCVKEIDNYYDEDLEIKWMLSLLILSFVMSLSALAAFYIPHEYLVYYSVVPVAYAYLVFKVINFSAVKIEKIRKNNFTLTKKEKPATKSMNLEDKVGPKVEKWVSEKKFCTDGLTIKDVALDMGTNQSYLSQYLNNALDTTFQVWLNTLRIEESKNLLISRTDLSIEEIGSMVGIPQNYNFSRWFKIVTDTTPFQYRRKHLSGN